MNSKLAIWWVHAPSKFSVDAAILLCFTYSAPLQEPQQISVRP